MTLTKAVGSKTCFAKVGVDDLKWPAQSPDLDITEHLCDELPCWLFAKVFLPDINSLILVGKPTRSSEKSSEKAGAHYTCKGGWSLEWDVQHAYGVMVGCPQSFSEIMYILDHHLYHVCFSRHFSYHANIFTTPTFLTEVHCSYALGTLDFVRFTTI